MNKNNGHVYIGSSKNINKRFSKHKRDLKSSKHHSQYLQNAWNKYGEESFSFDILLECSINSLFAYEQLFIDLCEIDGIYNICKIAGNTRGRRITDITRQKMKNRRHSQDVKNKISQTLKGRIPWNKGLRKDTNVVDNIST